MRKNFYKIGEYFTMVNNALTFGKIVKVVFDYAKEEFTYSFRIGNSEEEVILGNDTIFYSCEEKFRQGCPLGTNIELSPAQYHTALDDDNNVVPGEYRWIMADEPKRVLVVYGTLTFKENDVPTYTYVGEYTKENTYPSREECLYNSEYQVNINGKVETREGLGKMTQLNDKQKALLAEIEEKIKAFKEMGGALYYDTDLCEMRAFNTEKFQDWGFRYGNEGESEFVHYDEGNFCYPKSEEVSGIDTCWGDHHLCYTLKGEE